VDLGGFLAGVRPEDSSDVLDKVSFPPDRGGEEQGVQGGAVEALADLARGRWPRPAAAGRQAGTASGTGSQRVLAPIPPRSTAGS